MLLYTRRGMVILMHCHCYLGFLPFRLLCRDHFKACIRNDMSQPINDTRGLISLWLTARGHTVAFALLLCLLSELISVF